MSYCEIIPFKNGKPAKGIEFRNAWGGAARIWDALFNKYIKNPNIPYDSWIRLDNTPLWNLAKNENLQMFERSVHASTFNLAYIEYKNFKRFCADLRAFDAAYPSSGKANHLKAWAETIETLEAEAVGFYGTSSCDNLWETYYDEAKGEYMPTPLSKGFEVYEWLESLNTTKGAKP